MNKNTEIVDYEYRKSFQFGQHFIDTEGIGFLYDSGMEINEWVRSARTKAKMTQEQLSDAIGCTKANISAWENGRHEPSFSQITAISVLTNTPIPFDRNVTAGPNIGGEVPVISWVQAGNWQSVVDNYQPGFADEHVTATVQVNRHTYALRVHGDSMEPDFKEGDILIVEPEAEPFHGCYAIVKNGENEATFKKLIKDGGDWYLKPLNPDYPVKPLRDDMRIVGIVRQRVSKFF